MWRVLGRLALVVFLAVLDLGVELGRRRTLRRLRRASVEKLLQDEAPQEDPQGTSPAEMSRGIAERAEEIRRTLSRGTLSEAELEMCAFGYGRCAEDMLELARLVEDEMEGAGLLRRVVLKVHLLRASGSLIRVRDAFPKSAERVHR